MTATMTDAWPRRRRMPELADLDEPTQRAVRASIERLRHGRDSWIEQFLAVTRRYVPGYDALSDDEIRDSARSFIDGELEELSAFRIPDDALRARLADHAHRRLALGMSLETLTMAYQLGSRELLALMDRIGAEAGLPTDLLLAIHDSTWEFANEASAVFARVQRDLSVESARFDAERRAGYVRGVLAGVLPVEQRYRDAHLFGLDPEGEYTVLAARADGPDATDAVRRAIAASLRVGGDRLLVAETGSVIGGIVPHAPREPVAGLLLGLSRPTSLGRLDDAFEEAALALHAGERFGLTGLARLDELGPKPLVLSAERTAQTLEQRLRAVDDDRSGADLRETTRIYLECDQSADDTALRLTVHPNTVRYRVRRFQQLSGLELRRTEDLVTAWWLLNRGRDVPPRP